MKETLYPSILRRYLSSLIDAMFILVMMVLVGYSFQHDSDLAIKVRVGMLVFLFLIYEPLCTSKLCTIGQLLTDIRVRSNDIKQNISLPKAYVRIIFKVLLGFISFFSILFSDRKRAIHDIVVGSVVIKV